MTTSGAALSAPVAKSSASGPRHADDETPDAGRRIARAIVALGTGATGLWLALQCVMWGFIHIDNEHRETVALATAAEANTTLASIIADHLGHSVNAVDTTLRLARAGMRSGAAPEDYIATPATAQDVIHRFSLVDAAGRVTDAESRDGRPASPGEHSHLQAQKAAARDVLFVGGPGRSLSNGQRTISFSRPLRSARGVFEGALIGHIDIDHLTRPYLAASLRTGAVALLGPDDLVLARVGRRDLRDPVSRDDMNEDSCAPRAPALSPGDAVVCGRSVGDIHVVVAAATSLALQPAQQRQRLLSLGAALVTLFSLPMLATSFLRRSRLYSAEHALERAKQRASAAARDLRYALDSMSHGLMLLDIRGAIVLSNHRAHRLLGFPPNALPPRHNDDLIRHLAGLGDATPCLVHALVLGPTLTRTICPGPGGRYLDVRTRRLPEGGYVRTLENATRRHHDSLELAKARDAAVAASRARGDFLARMSHEIRTPMHAVMGFTRLLQQRPFDDETAGLLAQVSAASGHLIAVVDDVLDLSLIDAGHLRLQAAPFNLADLLRQLAPIAALTGEGKTIAFRWSVNPGVPEWLMGDQRRIFQILVNLVANAHKFTERGEVVVEATLVEFSEGPRLRVEVRDTGRGVDLATVTQLFETFARGPGTEGTPGAGLGLAIVKQLVDMMDGDLEVGCSARGGASFAFVLPLRAADPPGAPAPAAAAPALDVLVADDTPSSRMLAQAMLEARGHRAVVVADGAEALDACRQARFDLVLLDLQMPTMGGLAAAARIREEAGDGPRPFIAALTALVADVADIRAAGMDLVLRKPFSTPEFDDLLMRAAEARTGAVQTPNDV